MKAEIGRMGQKPGSMTHAELVERAARWLRVTRRHAPVLQEVGTVAESPDAIGWRWGATTLVECKASWEDFRRDLEKPFRRDPRRGMGAERWFFAELDLAKRIERYTSGADATPEQPVQFALRKWGVAFPTSGRAVKVLRKPGGFAPGERNLENETLLLVSAIRRATEGWGRKVFGAAAPPLVDGDPHPTTKRVIVDLRKENHRLREDRRALLAKTHELEARINSLEAALGTTRASLERLGTRGAGIGGD